MAGTTSSEIVLRAFYRPQRSCGKLMFFTPACNSVHRGGSLTGGSLSREVSVQGGRGLCLGGSLSSGVSG